METYDIAIIGAGPAGRSAAINAKIRNKKIIIFGKKESKKIVSAPLVDNYLGLPGAKGSDLQTVFDRHLEEMQITIEERKIDNIFPQIPLYKGKRVALVGYSEEAEEEANYLA